jgi:LacI family transcriptional regulator
MSVTIRKIAVDLKLAVSTVSKALRDSHEISSETKQRVSDYASKLDYLPNPYASSLKKRRSCNIAVVLPEVADSFFSIAINGIESVAQEMGYHVMIYLTHEDSRREESILREFRSGRVDGVLMSVSGGSNHNGYVYSQCAKETPLVFFDRVCEDTHAVKVVTDDFESGYKAAEHLILKGCKRIGFLAMTGNLKIIENRLNGFRKALNDHGQEIDAGHLVYGTHDEQINFNILRGLLSETNRPDALVGSVEKITTQAYSVCNELNLLIPNHIKIVAFSSTQIATLLNPSLTTITQPAYEMGKTAAHLLFKILEKKKIDVDRVEVLPSILIERNSSR